jgi:hypothetical protein
MRKLLKIKSIIVKFFKKILKKDKDKLTRLSERLEKVMCVETLSKDGSDELHQICEELSTKGL